MRPMRFVERLLLYHTRGPRLYHRSHLKLRKSRFYFRRRIPKPLVSQVGREELVLSLRTGCINSARVKAAYLDAELEVLFQRIKMGLIVGSEESIQELISITDLPPVS